MFMNKRLACSFWKGLVQLEKASISNVPRSRTYEVLESIEKKGFVKYKNW
jgi:hypothetical protein